MNISTLEILENAEKINIGEFEIFADGKPVRVRYGDIEDFLRRKSQGMFDLTSRRLLTAGEAMRQMIKDRESHRRIEKIYRAALRGDKDAKDLCRRHELGVLGDQAIIDWEEA